MLQSVAVLRALILSTVCVGLVSAATKNGTGNSSSTRANGSALGLCTTSADCTRGFCPSQTPNDLALRDDLQCTCSWIFDFVDPTCTVPSFRASVVRSISPMLQIVTIAMAQGTCLFRFLYKMKSSTAKTNWNLATVRVWLPGGLRSFALSSAKSL